MASLTIPITVAQLLDVARQLSPSERRALIDRLLAEQFDASMAAADRAHAHLPTPTDADIQSEIDAVRRQRRQDGRRAAGG